MSTIFPNLILEPVVQVNDRTRLDATKSFSASGDIDTVEIKPSASDSYIDVTTNKYLDWEYSASGDIDVSCRVTVDGASAEITRELTVITAASDYLFSTDADLRTHESDIMKWCQDGRNSYLDVHRRAQTIIIQWLNKEGYVDVNNEPYTKAAIVDIEEVKQWSTYIVLRLIFDSISNAVDDLFAGKAKYYKGQEVEWRNRAVLRLDIDGDGTVDEGEEVEPAIGFIARR